MAAASDVSRRCAWLIGEALQTEARAAELESEGNIPVAVLQHKRAVAKLSEAAELWGPEHPDHQALLDHAQDITTRVVYLESRGGAPADVPLEDHVGELLLSMALAEAAPPEEEQVSGLVARSGISGQTAPLTEEGFLALKALRSPPEGVVYLRRILDADFRQVRESPEAEQGLTAIATQLAGQGSEENLAPSSLRQLRELLHKQQWVELKLGPGQDKLQIAVRLEQEARGVDLGGPARAADAAMAYRRAIAVFELMLRFDKRSENAKIKEMVTTRLKELQDRVDQIEAEAAAAILAG